MPAMLGLRLSPCNMMGGGWSPIALGAACIEWWDARTSAKLTLGAGNAVSAWAGNKGVYTLAQATGSLQPVWNAAGYVVFDATDDYLSFTITSAVAQGQLYILTRFGWYKSGIGNWTAVTHRFNSADVLQVVFIDAAVITSAQRTALETYLGAVSAWFITSTNDTTIYNRIDNNPDINYTLSYTGANSAEYSLASSQAGATVDVGAQGLTATVHMKWPTEIGADVTTTVLYLRTNQFTGIISSSSENTALRYFDCNSNQFTGIIPFLTANIEMLYFHCYINQFTGSIPPLTTNTALIELRCQTNKLTGIIPSLYANTALLLFYCYDNQLNGYAGGGVSSTLINFNASINLLPAVAVNAILADFVAAGAVSGALNVGGTGNAAPTGQGLVDKATLQGLGWTVTTN